MNWMILLYIFILVMCIYLLKSREGYRGGSRGGGNRRDRWGKGPYGNPIPPGRRRGWGPYSNYWGGYGYGQGYYPYPFYFGDNCPLTGGCAVPVPVNPAPLPGYFGEYGVYGVPTNPYYQPYPCSAPSGVCYN